MNMCESLSAANTAFASTCTPNSFILEVIYSIREGGMAGVWVGFVDECSEKQIQEMQWRDLCIEEKVYHFKE
jgi:hypothetical protein